MESGDYAVSLRAVPHSFVASPLSCRLGHIAFVVSTWSRRLGHVGQWPHHTAWFEKSPGTKGGVSAGEGCRVIDAGIHRDYHLPFFGAGFMAAVPGVWGGEGAREWKNLCAVSLAGVLLAGMAQAEEPLRDPGLELRRQQEQQRWQQQGLQHRTSLPESAEPASLSDEGCLPVQHVVVDGLSVLPAAAVAALTDTHAGRCLSRGDLSLLLVSLNRLFAQQGYVSTRAYFPEQAVTGGELHVTVVQGRIESIKLNANPQDHAPQDHDSQRSGEKRRVRLAFPSGAGEVLLLPDLEQGIDQLNRVPSAQAQLALEPGSQPGTTVVRVHTVDDKPWRGALTADNSGESSTGKWRVAASFDRDNLIDANDLWQVSISTTERSEAASLSLTLPWRYWTHSLSGTASRYDNALGQGLTLDGHSRSWQWQSDRLLLRNSQQQWSIFAALSDRLSLREVAGAALTPDETVTTRVGVQATLRLSQQLWQSQLAWVQGTDWLGAVDDVSMPSAFPHHQFRKLEWQAQGQGVWPYAWQWQLDSRWQYSRTGLTGG